MGTVVTLILAQEGLKECWIYTIKNGVTQAKQKTPSPPVRDLVAEMHCFHCTIPIDGIVELNAEPNAAEVATIHYIPRFNFNSLESVFEENLKI